MINRDTELGNALKSIHRTVTDCQLGLINPTILENLTDYKPTVYNNTRWSVSTS